MLGEWLATAWLGVIVVLLLWVPGLAVGYLGGLRGIVAWGTAPLVSGGIIGTAAVAAGMVGVRWSFLVVVGATVVVCLITLAFRRIGRGWRPPGTTDRRSRRKIAWWVCVVGAVAVVFQAKRLISAMGDVKSFPQTFDAQYHLNSVRLIMQTGDASSLHMTLTTPGATSNFYPALWHGIAALVVPLAPGHEVTTVANWMTVVIATLVWPAAMLALARVLFGPRALMLGLTVALSFAFVQFPDNLTWYGILYPNLLSYAMLPALLALLLIALWRARGRWRLVPLWPAAIGSLGVLFAQPNGLFAIAYLLIPILLVFAVHLGLRARRRGAPWWRVALPTVVTILVFCAVYWATSEVSLVSEFRSKVTWPTRSQTGRSIFSVLDLSAMHPTGLPNVWCALLVIAGLAVAVFVVRWRWLVFGYVILGWLYVTSTSAAIHWRELFTGYWYGDSERLASLLPLLAVPLATIGLTAAIHAFAEAAERHLERGRVVAFATSTGTLAAVSVIALCIVVPRSEVYRTEFQRISDNYTYWSDSPGVFVDKDEEQLMTEIEKIVPADSVIAGNPWNGASMTWALADRQALFPQTPAPDAKPKLSPDQELIASDLGSAATDPAVCAAVRRQHVGYVYTSDSYLWGNDGSGYEALTPEVLDKVGTVVAQDGSARLYRITACG